MSEKESVKTDEQEKKPQKSPVKEVRRYTGANKKVPEKLNETETGYANLAEKNRDDNSNLPLTEDKTDYDLNSPLRVKLPIFGNANQP